MISPVSFRNTIITTYLNTFEKVEINRRGNPVKITPTADQVLNYKNWLLGYISQMVITDPYIGKTSGRSLLEHEALKIQAIPPFGPLYPKIRRAISVLTKEEMLIVFNPVFVNKFLRSF